MQLDLWFDLAVRGEPDLQGELLRRLDLAESSGPAPEPMLDSAPDAGFEAQPVPSDDLFC